MLKVILVVAGLMPSGELRSEFGGTYDTPEACQKAATEFFQEAEAAGLNPQAFRLACLRVEFPKLAPAGDPV